MMFNVFLITENSSLTARTSESVLVSAAAEAVRGGVGGLEVWDMSVFRARLGFFPEFDGVDEARCRFCSRHI